MNTINSKFKLNLPTAPGQQENAGLFNELLSTYAGLRTVFGAMAGIFDLTGKAQEELAAVGAESNYLINGITKIIVEAGENVLAGKFLELYYSGTWKVRHTKLTASYTYGSCLGISLEDVDAGKFVQVITGPAIVPGFSGLSSGTTYFAYVDGQFVDIPGVTRPGGSGTVDLIPCGIAVGPNKMRLISTF